MQLGILLQIEFAIKITLAPFLQKKSNRLLDLQRLRYFVCMFVISNQLSDSIAVSAGMHRIRIASASSALPSSTAAKSGSGVFSQTSLSSSEQDLVLSLVVIIGCILLSIPMLVFLYKRRKRRLLNNVVPTPPTSEDIECSDFEQIIPVNRVDSYKKISPNNTERNLDIGIV